MLLQRVSGFGGQLFKLDKNTSDFHVEAFEGERDNMGLSYLWLIFFC